MINGEVNADLEAAVPIVVCGNNREERQISAVIDTGFTGYLTLPSELVAALDLDWLSVEDAFLGDGSIHSFDVYRATVIWDGQRQEIEANLTETGPLIGMAMLFGHSLHIEAVSGGLVRIVALTKG